MMPPETAATSLEWVFFGMAIVGTILLLSRIILMLLGLGDHGGGDVDGGGDVGHSLDMDADADVDGDIDGDAHQYLGDHASDHAFKLLSLHGVMAFCSMFGLVGLAVLRSGMGGQLLALVAALCAGGGSMYGVAWLFSFMLSMQSSGTVSLNMAIGQEGRVYLTVGKGKHGQVEVAVQGRLMVLDAMALCDEELPTGSRVMVERLVSEGVLGVVGIDSNEA